jgi:hypothetical protein
VSYVSEIFTTPVLTNIMFMCFVAAAACMGVNYHRQIDRLQKQNERLIAGVQQILAIAETMSGQKQGAE